ncbi:MAG: AAA family ATPase, partial [Alphaproteobacteria bacterium]
MTPTPLPSRVYAIASGKGGVGKTSFTLNLATQLAKQGKKVLVVDGDTGLANLDVQLNIKPAYDIGHVLAGQATVAQALTPTPQGFTLLAGRAGDAHLANLPLPSLHSLISNVRNAGFPIVLIDISAGIHTQALAFCAAADTTLLLTTPDPAAFTDAYALLKLLWANHGVANAHL